MLFSNRKMTVLALFAAAMCVVSPFSLAIGPVPLSLATLVLYITVAILGTSGTISVTLYLLLGAVGLPVFSGGGAGLEKLLGPTGGYLVGYIPCAFIAGLLIDMFEDKKLAYPLAMIAGTVVLYALGTAWFIVSMGMRDTSYTLGSALMVCVVPFLTGDAVKIVLASALGLALRKVLDKQLKAIR